MSLPLQSCPCPHALLRVQTEEDEAMTTPATSIKLADLRQMDAARLKELIVELKRALLNLRFQKAAGQLKKTHEVLRIRRSVAQIKTILSLKTKVVRGGK